jgi:putative DNA primase/helicase
MQEIMGYCMTTETTAHKLFLFQGDGSNGKSVLCKVIEKLVGEENTSSISLSSMNKDFSIAEIVDKLVNISTESEIASLNTEKVKAISSGDSIQINAKFAGVYSYKPFAKLIFCVNNLPYMPDKTSAMRRRLVIIPFEYSYVEGEPVGKYQKKMDKDMERKLIKELAGIFNFALTGLERLEANKYKFTESKEAMARLNQYLEDNDPYLSYIRREIEAGLDKEVEQNTLHEHFTNWATENGHPRMAMKGIRRFLNEFRMTLKRENIAHDKRGSGNLTYETGITLKSKQTTKNQATTGKRRRPAKTSPSIPNENEEE